MSIVVMLSFHFSKFLFECVAQCLALVRTQVRVDLLFYGFVSSSLTSFVGASCVLLAGDMRESFYSRGDLNWRFTSAFIDYVCWSCT